MSTLRSQIFIALILCFEVLAQDLTNVGPPTFSMKFKRIGGSGSDLVQCHFTEKNRIACVTSAELESVQFTPANQAEVEANQTLACSFQNHIFVCEAPLNIQKLSQNFRLRLKSKKDAKFSDWILWASNQDQTLMAYKYESSALGARAKSSNFSFLGGLEGEAQVEGGVSSFFGPVVELRHKESLSIAFNLAMPLESEARDLEYRLRTDLFASEIWNLKPWASIEWGRMSHEENFSYFAVILGVNPKLFASDSLDFGLGLKFEYPQVDYLRRNLKLEFSAQYKLLRAFWLTAEFLSGPELYGNYNGHQGSPHNTWYSHARLGALIPFR